MATRTRAASSTRSPRRPRTATPMESARQRVAERAHALFLARGWTHGDDIGDWLTAERELSATTSADVPS